MLDAWAASPARFREDANAEEDYALGGYRDRTRELVSAMPALAGELASRSGHVPVPRLPFALGGVDDGGPLDGFATMVGLPLRDEAAGRLVARLLAETGPALLLASFPLSPDRRHVAPGPAHRPRDRASGRGIRGAAAPAGGRP